MEVNFYNTVGVAFFCFLSSTFTTACEPAPKESKKQEKESPPAPRDDVQSHIVGTMLLFNTEGIPPMPGY